MSQWLKDRTLPVRILAYVVVAASVFAVSAGLGAIGALMLRGDPALPGAEEPPPVETNTGEARREQEHTASDAAAHQSEAEYTGKVGDIQAEAVETFLGSHDKLLRYDALTAEDVEQMREDGAALQESVDQIDGLDPPENYEQHREVFRSAVNEMQEAARLSYVLAAEPTAATRSGFDEYDRHVSAAADRLQRSNQILGREYKTIEGAQQVNPL